MHDDLVTLVRTVGRAVPDAVLGAVDGAKRSGIVRSSERGARLRGPVDRAVHGTLGCTFGRAIGELAGAVFAGSAEGLRPDRRSTG